MYKMLNQISLHMMDWYYYSHSNKLNDCIAWAQLYFHVWIGGVMFITWLVSVLDSILIHYDTNINFAFSTWSSIHIQIEWLTADLVLNHILSPE